jgi:methyl-accepting chemotaxis protein
MGKMLKLSNMPLWVQSAIGPAAILVLFILSAIFSILQLGSMADRVDILNQADQLAECLYKAQSHQDGYLLRESETDVEGFSGSTTRAEELIQALSLQAADDSLRASLHELSAIVDQYAKTFKQVVDNSSRLRTLTASTTEAYTTIVQTLNQNVKAPLEQKKNDALVLGQEFDLYHQELLSLTEKMYALIMTCRLAENNYFLHRLPDDANAFNSGIATVIQTFEEWKFVIDTLDDASMNQLPSILKKAFKSYSQEVFAQRAAIDADNRQITKDMLSLKEKGLDQIRFFKQETSILVEHTQKAGLKNMALFLALGMVFGLGISLLSGRRISRPVRRIVAMLKDIAEGDGDLSKRLNVHRSDELGEQARWFNVFVEKIAELVREIKTFSGQLSDSSGQLSQVAGQMAGNAGMMKQKSQNVATTAEDMSDSIRNVASTMDLASANMETIVRAAEEMNGSIHGIADNSEKARTITSDAVELARRTSEHVDGLGRAAEQIGKVTDTIAEISEQTNLLALNATIEAARAGESGKGFAVVAAEIKELAGQTATATREISDRVNNIQDAASTAAEGIVEIDGAIQNVDDFISSISDAISEQTTATNDIATNVTEASDGLGNINEHISQSSSKAEGITGEISAVDETAAAISDNGLAVDGSAQDLSRLSDQLKTLVARFVVD